MRFGDTARGRPSSARPAILVSVSSTVKALAITAAYLLTVGAVGAALALTADDTATPWLALLAAMAVLHLGFGLLVVRFSAALLPLLASVLAMLAKLGDFSITTLLVGVPCALLVVAGVALRIGWTGGPRASPAEQIARERRKVEAQAWDESGDWDPVQPPVWDDAIA
jgi:hypothetical protein